MVAGGNESPVSAKYCARIGAFAFDTSMAGSKDRVDDDRLRGAGERGEGAGEWLLSEIGVGEDSATGDEVFQPKKEVSLLGPGDLDLDVVVDS